MLLQACLNGARLPREHPGLPVTAAALAGETARVATRGAGAVHLHVKDPDGVDTLDAQPLAEVLDAVRAAAPGVPVGVTTGAWATPDPGSRLAAVRRWQVLPDFASVNWHEEGAPELATLLLDLGVGVEAGLWHEEAAERWSAWPHRDRTLRVLLEVPGGVAGAAAVECADRLRAAVTPASQDVPVLLHGEDASCWPVLEHAVRLGLDTRVGLEDTLVLPDGSPAPDNAALVAAAQEIVRLRDPRACRPGSNTCSG